MRILSYISLYLISFIGFYPFLPNLVFDKSPTNFVFLYEYSFKKFQNLPERTFNDYMIVSTDGDSIYSQFYNQMKIDSIQSFRELSDVEFGGYTLRNPPTRISIVNDTCTFYGRVGSDYLMYKEALDFKWQFQDSMTTIGKYSCRLAKTTYAGREWFAWYTSELPINVGPYKFNGLPGCIVEVYDSQNFFKFSLVQLKQRSKIRLKPFPSVLTKQHIETSRKRFNKIQQAYFKLSFNEQMTYMNRDKSDADEIKMISQDDDQILSQVNLNAPGKYRFIEIDLN